MESFSKVNGALNGLQTRVQNVFSSVVNIPNIIAGTAFGGLIASTVKADMAYEALENRMSAAIGKFTDSAEEIQYLRSEADRMGISFTDLTNSYSGFAAASTRAGISVAETRRIFKDISETAVSMKLSPERVRLVFMALEQMASKGVVSMEELRRQLGDSFPAAMEIGAKAMDMGNAAFNKLVASGELLSADFIPRFSRQVREELGGSFETSANKLQANIARMGNAFFDMKQKIGDAISPIVNEIVQSLRERVALLTKDIEENKEKIVAAIQKIPYYFDKFLDSLIGIVKFVNENKEVFLMAGFLFASAKAIVALNDLRVAMIGLNLALATNPILAVAAAIAALGLVVVHDVTAINKKIEETMENIPAREKAREIETLYLLLQKYGEAFDQTDFGGNFGEVGKYSGELSDDIKGLESSIGEFGISVQGTLLEKMSQVEGMLDKLQGKVKDASATVKSFSPIVKQPPLPETEKKQTAADKKAPWWMGAGRSIRTSDTFRLLRGDWNKTVADMYTTYNNFSVKLLGSQELLALRFKEIWKDFKNNTERQFEGMFDTLTDLNSRWVDKFQTILQQAYRMATGLLWEYLSAYIRAKMLESSTGSVVSAKTNTENLSNAATGGVKTAVDGAGSVARIPYVGAALAVAAIATIMGIVYSQINKAKAASKGYASGTNYAHPGWHLVGENGPEMRYFRGGERVLSHEKSLRAIGGANISLTVNGNLDKDTADHAIKRLRQFANDYNAAIRGKFLRTGYAR